MIEISDNFVPIDTTKPFEIVIVVFKHNFENHGDERVSMAQTNLWFKDTAELLEWSDGAGVDFS
jgi:hypothetical protein